MHWTGCSVFVMVETASLYFAAYLFEGAESLIKVSNSISIQFEIK